VLFVGRLVRGEDAYFVQSLFGLFAAGIEEDTGLVLAGMVVQLSDVGGGGGIKLAAGDCAAAR